MTVDLPELFRRAGDPLDLAGLWQDGERAEVERLCSVVLAEARKRFPDDVRAQVTATFVGVYAHAFMVGRDHARQGLALPERFRRDLTGLTDADVDSFVIPSDVRDLL